LKEKFFYTKALTPAKPWLDKMETERIKSFKVIRNKNDYSIRFNDSLKNDSRFYVVYIFNNKNLNTSDPKNIYKIVGREYSQVGQSISIDKNRLANNEYIGISIKDRSGVETPVKIVHLKNKI
ncbi:MAG: hypothetical protein KA336_04770, partial [Fusobacteriaceae bacterium]|nr:hypothetical protein [Fusobacteriaceae bacterium]